MLHIIKGLHRIYPNTTTPLSRRLTIEYVGNRWFLIKGRWPYRVYISRGEMQHIIDYLVANRHVTSPEFNRTIEYSR